MSKKALPIPAAESTDIVDANPTVSHKITAHVASLMDRDELSPQYAPGVRLTDSSRRRAPEKPLITP
jgi:hypothetical protein